MVYILIQAKISGIWQVNKKHDIKVIINSIMYNFLWTYLTLAPKGEFLNERWAAAKGI